MVLSTDLESFQQHLINSPRILALVGSGLSASSGLTTFRGKGGLWRSHDAIDLATPDAFHRDPSLVWQFYSYRRHTSLKARPNKGHFALAELANRKDNFLTLTQNVDGLSQRAGHPPGKLLNLHGDLFTVKCTEFMCSYVGTSYNDPIVPALSESETQIPESELPHCPSCKVGLLRPGVVWFGEPLPFREVTMADKFLMEAKVDLILVVGTSCSVWPAAGYVERVARSGGKVAVFNTDISADMDDMDEEGIDGWAFKGDAAEWLPKALEPIIGKCFVPRQYQYE
ncbi:DHS-like NAD/FAD-binding domain-containing protein [Nadsonia fulvescens var. elongata DSM 6958]|uniref:DHS-like NAD/FAD-binding domain-containing protein n=1 Tax=Nadsonia fulvescens var. elongata DSM 6958 TaxID=857566 RepID=A0A1E3PRT3_9ASCO|nr:DHS-like NAD/FAD-binding domain-containing protein [Nadsonia fulvescens var. elongata DSM 6958]